MKIEWNYYEIQVETKSFETINSSISFHKPLLPAVTKTSSLLVDPGIDCFLSNITTASTPYTFKICVTAALCSEIKHVLISENRDTESQPPLCISFI